MDSSSHQQQQATTSSQQQPQPEVRSSARAKDKPDDTDPSALPSARNKNKRSAKSKANESEDSATRPAKRTRRNPPQPALTINEPVRDPKGKERAAPEPNSDEDDSPGPSAKRPRTSSYSLRSSTLKDSTDMPRKTRAVAKGKAAVKSKPVAGSSRLEDEDTEMLDAEYSKEEEAEEHEEHPEDDDDDDDEDDDGEGDGGMPGGPPIPGGLDETTAMAIFGDYRQFGSYMLSLSSRLKTMLNNIKATADPTTRLVTLQELSELLSISTEDTLAGSFQVEQFVRELVKILGGRGNDEDEDDDGGEEPPEQDEDAALAAALAMSSGGYQGDDNLEAQVLACRCLANLMEALPGVAHTVVYHGAIPVLCSKLIEISYIDLAEQTLSTLEKISEEFPSSIVREGGLSALLNYLDFFSIAIRGVWPIIRKLPRVLGPAPRRVRVPLRHPRRRRVPPRERREPRGARRHGAHPRGERAAPPRRRAARRGQHVHTARPRACDRRAREPENHARAARADIVDTLYQILTGVLPPAGDAAAEQGGASGGQGLGGGLADMTVMENLAHRPKDQVEETLSLVSELMPPLPKDGVFDHKGYTEKSLARMVKAKAKAERAAARQATHASLAAAMLIASSSAAAAAPADDSASGETAVAEPEEGAASAPPTPDRLELLRSKPAVVGRVITPVRVKTLTGLLKAVSFLDADGLKRVLTFVPVASFASSILSSKDHPTLVIGFPRCTSPPSGARAVFHEMEVLSSRNIVSANKEPAAAAASSSSSSAKDKEKEKEKETSESPAPPDADADPADAPPPQTLSAASGSGSVPAIPGFKKLSSLSLEPEDAITLRARVIQFKYLSGDDDGAGDGSFGALQRLVERIGKDGSEKDAAEALREMAELFGAPHSSVSSFELLQSGVVDGLLQFATDGERKLSLAKRKELLLDAFAGRRTKTINGAPSPYATFVKKLQESLTRMESFDVVTVAQGADDSKRSSPSLLARQLRLRLVAGDESDVPRNLHNIVVSIHAIATFQALHDYLRPPDHGLSGMLAALAASGFTGTAPPTPGEAPPAPPMAPPAAAAESSSAGAAASASASTSGSTITRRRSQRLSAKNAPAAEGSDGAAGSSSIEGGPPSNLMDSEMAADFTDEEEVDAEVFDDDVDPDNSIADKTVTLSIAEDGSKVEAQTPDGTRVATPSLKEGQPSPAPRAPATRASYASALKAKPTDWHLEFSMDDQHEMRKKTGALPPNLIWQGVYTVKFKKVSGPAPAADARPENGEGSSKSRSPSPTLSSLPEDAPHAKILRLLRVLHQLNTLEAERSVFVGEKRNLPESAFVNNKLTAKLTRQLEEPMIVASSCLPDWALDLPQHFPFLFPFATRYNFLQSTSFGYARLILKWQSQQARVQDNSRRDEGIGFLGRLQRQKVRISRKHILESAVKVFELYGSSSSVLEVEYFEEVGTGLGPTLEFYSLVSKEFARKDLKIWRDGDAAGTSPYVDHPSGLYPAPISSEDIASDGGHKRTHIFRVIGQFVAKAMLDSRIIDLSLNKIFLKIVLGEEVPLTVATLRLVDISLANSLDKIQSIVSTRAQAENDKLKRKVALLETVSIDDLALDFTIPGYDIELRPGGRDIAVTADNVEGYIREVLDAIIGQGAQLQAKAFREGFSKAFSADELVLLFGNSEEDWSVETLSEALKADHGFNGESRAIRDLVEILTEYDATTRRNYLQFVTGSPKLPIGGFRGLNPPLTVVRKPHEAPLTADDYLPSVMTCVNYLKLPEYSSKEIMREKLRVAIQEGMGSFHLS
ncbi:hypothetical protein B0H14DRAFT_2963210 [Mycena olivaceomarginata]|nr:hypothetical protein B0H14DRAFT_2963210 [Mycena olivaceomarginata]